MRIFITGATGFLGAHALAALAAAGHDVAALVRPETVTWRIRRHLESISIVPGSLDAAEGFARDLAAFGPDAVLNLAWSGVSNRTHDDSGQAGNLARVERLLAVSADAGAAHWVGLGSQAEYGPRDHPIAENEPTLPATAYGRAKLAACEHARAFCAERGMRFAWLRLFSCYGPMDKESWLIPSLIIKLLAGEAPALTGGRQRMDYLYAADAAAAIRAVLETPDAAGVYNLGSGQAVPVRDIATRIRDLVDPALGLGFGEISQTSDAPMLMQADISRLRSTVGWAPKTALEDGLATTVAWYRERARR